MRLIAVAWALCLIAVAAAAQVPSASPGPRSEHPVEAPKVQTGQRPQSGAQPEQHANPEQQSTAQAAPIQPSVLPLGAKGEGQPKAENGSEEGTEFWPPFAGLKLKITDTILAVFTAGLFFATYALWLATRALVRGADKTAERQLRAYVSIDEAGMAQMWPSQNVRFTIAFRNYGQTPAYEVQTCVRPAYGGADQIPYDEDYTFGSKSVIGPGATVTVSGVIDLTPDKLNFVRNRECRLFVWGRVNYVDAFGQNRFFSFKAYNDIPHTSAVSGTEATYLSFGVSPAKDGYQAN